MAEVVVSVAVTDWLPAVLSVTTFVNVYVPASPATKVKFAGSTAWASLLVNWIVPVYLVSVFPLEFWAVTVRLNDVPAVSAVGGAVRTS